MAVNKKNVLVVAAHPDDEVLGCGATISKFSKLKYNVNVLILGKGLDSRLNFSKKNSLEKKRTKLLSSAIKANKLLGVKKINFENFPDNQFDTVSLLKIAKIIESHIMKSKPNTILTHSISDLNIDHQKTFEAVMTATRTSTSNFVKNIYSFEVPSSTDWAFNFKKKNFIPNLFINVEKEIQTKLKALKFYSSEMRNFPNSRSIENCKYLAYTRGASIGCKAAECFEVIRSIKD